VSAETYTRALLAIETAAADVQGQSGPRESIVWHAKHALTEGRRLTTEAVASAHRKPHRDATSRLWLMRLAYFPLFLGGLAALGGLRSVHSPFKSPVFIVVVVGVVIYLTYVERLDKSEEATSAAAVAAVVAPTERALFGQRGAEGPIRAGYRSPRVPRTVGSWALGRSTGLLGSVQRNRRGRQQTPDRRL
jgi:hypothetical protein